MSSAAAAAASRSKLKQCALFAMIRISLAADNKRCSAEAAYVLLSRYFPAEAV
jgi:hypothetical protein